MTATQPRPRAGHRTYPAPGYIECPVCHVPTWRITATQGRTGWKVEPLPAAARGVEPARCARHARTPADRAAQAARALDDLT